MELLEVSNKHYYATVTIGNLSNINNNKKIIHNKLYVIIICNYNQNVFTVQYLNIITNVQSIIIK